MRWRWLDVIWRAYRSWKAHDVPLLSAAIAFYAMLSLSPLLVVAVAVVALVIDPGSASRYLTEVMTQVANEQTAQFAQEVLKNTQRSSSTVSATSVSLLLMLFGSARLFRQLKTALNIVWEVPSSGQGLRAVLRGHLLAVLMVLIVAVALVLWLGVDVALQAISSRVATVPVVWRWVSFGAGWVLITLLFATAYHLLPDAPTRWREMWAGAGIGAFLFVLCKLVVGLYLGVTGVHSVYGAASAGVVLLLWAYFSAQAFLFGAECARAARQRMPAEG
ncbi:MAG: YihY/virulence factor BrkB family protein [Armatimonadota bacterium]